MNNSSLEHPGAIPGQEYRFDAFEDGKVLHKKKKGRMPAMGWNSWNAFGSGNTEQLTLEMAKCIKELGLDKLGYRYLVLDDGCYRNERVNGLLTNDEVKFPHGFRYLADRLHEMGLKFGMYNDIGTNLCAGAAVGTCGHEREDAGSYISWDVDFLKVDNCYYLWDDATFSDKENAKYVFAPALGKVVIRRDEVYLEEFSPGINMHIVGNGIHTEDIDGKLFFTHIGTFDGTGPAQTPVGVESGEVVLDADIPEDGTYDISIELICGRSSESGRGEWLQAASECSQTTQYQFDGLIDGKDCEGSGFCIKASLKAGRNRIRFMNHRRQENTLMSYAKLLEGLKEAAPDRDIVYSLCEWGKTQPQNWGWKVADSWRILNDITFAVGSDGNPGKADWVSGYTNSVTSQYNKAVVMDEFSGTDRGWNDPDMMVIGMDGLNSAQNRTHMVMWCMMNSPLMLGLDLRRVKKGDELYRVIANEEMIALDQDKLGIQAKRIYTDLIGAGSDKEYITNNDRVDILAKPLSDGSVAVSFINLSGSRKDEGYSVSAREIAEKLGDRMAGPDTFINAGSYVIRDLWTKEESKNCDGVFRINDLEAYDNYTIRIIPG
ncbi:MAG: glycoside hydrolase family 27 protein [Lachnospiraceae bacterium]|nr:glycoside hydrolase family 27 protein [Lachnospiraceae bacterium]